VLLLTGINFYTLMWLLPILGDWSCFTKRCASASVIAAAFPSSAFFLGVSLIAAQIVVGFAKIDTWPIAVFPCFDYENRAATTTRAEVRLRQNGSTAPPSGDDVVLERLNGGRYARLMDRTLRDAEQRRRYLDEYAAVLARAGFAVPKANLEIWEVVHHRDPARASENPVSERRLSVP
jgi:hypothetical protein